MSKKNTKNEKKSEVNAMFLIILLALVMFIISTYAWFSTQKNVSITNLSGTVEVAEGLEISLDAENWSNGIVLGTNKDNGEKSIIDDAYRGNKNISPSEMLPVSTLGLVSGNMTDIKMLRGKITNSKELSDIVAMRETDTASSSPTYPGYFAFDVFLKNSSKDESKNDVLQLNYDSSLEILETEKSATGLQNTARIAFAKYNGTADVMDSQSAILAATTGDSAYITDVAIWEPNSSDHVEYIVKNNNKITWSSNDSKIYSPKGTGFETNTQMPTYGLKESSIGSKINDIYKWDGTESNIDKQNTLQTTKTSEDNYAINEGVQNLVSATDGSTDFWIVPSKICRLRIYLWLEGQDVDCINYASHGGGIKVNIGLVKGSTPGSKGELPEG